METFVSFIDRTEPFLLYFKSTIQTISILAQTSI